MRIPGKWVVRKRSGQRVVRKRGMRVLLGAGKRGGGQGSGNFLAGAEQQYSNLHTFACYGRMQDYFRHLRELGYEVSAEDGKEDESLSDSDASFVTARYNAPPGLFGEEWDSEDDWDTDLEEWHPSEEFLLPKKEHEDKKLMDFLDSL